MDYTWDLSPLAVNDHDQQLKKARLRSEKAVKEFVTNWRHRTDYLSDAETLLKAIKDYEQLLREVGVNDRAWYYFHLRSTQDQLDPGIKAGEAMAEEVAVKLSNELQFFTLQLAKVPAEQQQAFLQSTQLEPYHHFLERLFAEGAFTLSEAEERVLNLLSSSSHDAWVRLTSTQLAKTGAETKIGNAQSAYQTLPQLLSLLSNQQKEVRDQAASHVHRIMAENAAVATAELNAILGRKKVVDELRGFTRPDQARHQADDISTTTVEALVTAVTQKFDIANRYYRLKAALLKQPSLAYHERNVEFGEIDQQYTFEQAVEITKQVFTDLDPQFSQIFQQFIDNRQLDVYPRQGKVGGAFCAHNLVTQPTYVLLNHTDRLQDVLTLAHEMGHAINNELMREVQGPLTFDTPLATAEVASTFMEDFVLQRLSADADKPTRLAINVMKLNDDVSSIFRQIAAYQFEQELHQQFRSENYLSEERIGEIFTHHMQQYMGPAVEQSPGSQNWWVYWSHFRTFFYVYSYASGLLISKSLQEMVQADSRKIAAVKEFLAAGTSASPDQIFSRMSIDITAPTFWAKGLKQVEQLLNQTEQLARELGYQVPHD